MQPEIGLHTENGLNTYTFNIGAVTLENALGATGSQIGEFLCIVAMVPTSVTHRSYLFLQGGIPNRLVSHMPWEGGHGYFDFGTIGCQSC